MKSGFVLFSWTCSTVACWLSILLLQQQLIIPTNAADELIFDQIQQTVFVGEDAYLVCRPAPFLTKWNILWIKDGQIQESSNRIIDQFRGSYRLIKNVRLEDDGVYHCIVQFPQETVRKPQVFQSKKRKLTVLRRIPSKIAYPPTDRVVPYGSKIQLRCIVTGNSHRRIIWVIDSGYGHSMIQHQHYPLLVLAQPKIENNRFLLESTRLIIIDVTPKDSGSYQCLVEGINRRIIDRVRITLTVSQPDSRDKRTEDDSGLKKQIHKLLEELKTKQEKMEKEKNTTTNKKSSASSISSAEDLLRQFRQPDENSAKMDKQNLLYEYLIEQMNTIQPNNLSDSPILGQKILQEIASDTNCGKEKLQVTCLGNYRYRTFNGSCNNFDHPTWGMKGIPLRRMLQPFYENGFHWPIGFVPNRKYFGFPKPSARDVSRLVMSSATRFQHPFYTDMHNHFGQLLALDIDLTTSPSTSQGFASGKSCSCIVDFPCFPIKISQDDPKYFERKCDLFTRSAAACYTNDGDLSPRHTPPPRGQLNQISAYIDSSMLYGSDETVANLIADVNSYDGTLRKGLHIYGGDYLLQNGTGAVFCTKQKDDPFNCFVSGDRRGNEQLIMMSLITLLFREHNRIAVALGQINPHWLRQSGRIYQETRKIIIALFQHITYEHWLPKLIGPRGVTLMGDYQGYDPTMDATVSNVFAASAFRYGHGINRGILLRIEENGLVIPQGNIQLRDAFFAPSRLIREGGIEPLLRGATRFAAKLMDARQPVDSELTEHLFEVKPRSGFDLMAFDIQRGRDHGLPGYNEWRAACGLQWADSFDDLRYEITVRSARRNLEKVYGHPGNIDSIVGIILEKPRDGAQVGPTGLCLLIDQFKRLRDGDRFFYRRETVFKKSQLAEITKMSLARIMCNVGHGIRRVQKDIFKIPQADDFISCSEIPQMNLEAWKQ